MRLNLSSIKEWVLLPMALPFLREHSSDCSHGLGKGLGFGLFGFAGGGDSRVTEMSRAQGAQEANVL